MCKVNLLFLSIIIAGCSNANAPSGLPNGGASSSNATQRSALVEASRGTRPVNAADTAGRIYVTNDTEVKIPGTAEIDYWAIGANGNVSPTGVINGSRTRLVFGIEGIVATASEIYVAENLTNEVLGFPLNANGNIAPNVILHGSNTGIRSPTGLALDSSDNLYVANYGVCGTDGKGPYSVEEFVAGSNGNVTPLRQILGPHTEIQCPAGLALDSSGDLYVTDEVKAKDQNAGKITVFSPSANGDATPLRIIAGSATSIVGSVGVAVTQKNIFVQSYPAGPSSPYILKFALDADGNVAPLSYIHGPRTGINPFLEGLATDIGDKHIYGIDRGTYLGGSPLPSILEFGVGDTGDASPITDITGSNTRLFVPNFIFVT